MRYLVLSALVCVLATAGNAWADDECPPQREATPASQCVIMPREGQPGAWLALPRFDQVTKAYALAPAVAEQLKHWQATAEARGREAEQWQSAAEARKDAAVALATTADKALAIAEQARSELAAEQARASAWYRNPWLWFGVGLAVGAGGVTAVAITAR